MTLQEAVTICLRQKYATFRGRASRSEYWFFMLGCALFLMAGAVVFFVLNAATGGPNTQSGISGLGALVLFAVVVGYLGLIIPSLSVTVRRFHDMNLSGWLVLLGYVLGAVPIVGAIASLAMFVITVMKGTNGDNSYGPDPLATPPSAPWGAGPIL